MRINGERLIGRLRDLAKIGATRDGGVTRLALSTEDSEARALVIRWASDRGFQCRRDAMGNLFVSRPGTEPYLPPIMTGSHLDTQRNGGNFDGIYGVVAGFEVLESLADAERQTRHTIELAIWNNEEGVRFAPVTMGSGVWGGQLQIETILAHTDGDGVSVEQALAEDSLMVPALKTAELGWSFHGYIEAHIEQGPVLERANLPIGVVTGIQGTRQFRFRISGDAAHAGTTPMDVRKDAFLAAVELHQRLREIADVNDTDVRFTVGTFSVWPGTPNTVPGAATFTVDFRSPDADKLRERGDRMLATASDAIEVTQLIHSEPVAFDETVRACVSRSAASLNLGQMDLLSGATHDARNVAHLGPTGMIFVPSRDGVSHNPREWTDPAHLAQGCEVLAHALLDLDRTAFSQAA